MNWLKLSFIGLVYFIFNYSESGELLSVGGGWLPLYLLRSPKITMKIRIFFRLLGKDKKFWKIPVWKTTDIVNPQNGCVFSNESVLVFLWPLTLWALRKEGVGIEIIKYDTWFRIKILETINIWCGKTVTFMLSNFYFPFSRRSSVGSVNVHADLIALVRSWNPHVLSSVVSTDNWRSTKVKFFRNKRLIKCKSGHDNYLTKCIW